LRTSAIPSAKTSSAADSDGSRSRSPGSRSTASWVPAIASSATHRAVARGTSRSRTCVTTPSVPSLPASSDTRS
jgi:hypothetical protein